MKEIHHPADVGITWAAIRREQTEKCHQQMPFVERLACLPQTIASRIGYRKAVAILAVLSIVAGGINKGQIFLAEALQNEARFTQNVASAFLPVPPQTAEVLQPQEQIDISLPGFPAQIGQEAYVKLAKAALDEKDPAGKFPSFAETIKKQGYTLEEVISGHVFSKATFLANTGSGSAIRFMPFADEKLPHKVGGINAGQPFDVYGYLWVVNQNTGQRQLFGLVRPWLVKMKPKDAPDWTSPTYVVGRMVSPGWVLLKNGGQWVTENITPGQ